MHAMLTSDHSAANNSACRFRASTRYTWARVRRDFIIFDPYATEPRVVSYDFCVNLNNYLWYGMLVFVDNSYRVRTNSYKFVS